MLYKIKEDTAHLFPQQGIGRTYSESEMCVLCPESLRIDLVTVYTGQTRLEIENS